MLNRLVNHRGFLSLALTLSLFMCSSSLLAGKGNGGGKPPVDDPPEPVADGTIYITQGNTVYAMNSDGSNLTLVIPADVATQYYGFPYGTVVPSHHAYGDDPFFDRWWLGVKSLGVDPSTGLELKELVAFWMDRNESDPEAGPLVVAENQLTDAFSSGFLIAGTRWVPAWGPNDAFVSCKSTEFGIDATDGSPFFIAGHVVRLEVSGEDLMFATSDLFLSSDSEGWSLAVSHENGYEQNFVQHGWGPQGDTVVYSSDDASADGTKLDLFFRDSTGTSVKLWDSTFLGLTFDWSKDATLIALDAGDEIRLLNLSGNSTVVLTDGSREFYSDPRWAPDSSQFLVKRTTRKGGIDPFYNYFLERMSRDGSDLVSIPIGFDESVSFQINSWVSNDLPQ